MDYSIAVMGCAHPINLGEVVVRQNILRQDLVTDEGVCPVGDIVQQPTAMGV